MGMWIAVVSDINGKLLDHEGVLTNIQIGNGIGLIECTAC